MSQLEEVIAQIEQYKEVLDRANKISYADKIYLIKEAEKLFCDNAALSAAEELVSREKQFKSDRPTLSSPNPVLDKQYFIANYGSLKNSKIAYQKIYGKQNYGRSWSDFIVVARKLTLPKQQTLTLEERVTKLENFLSSLGYQL